jgi:pimeloyl-ACP methyl ester carboxylesterase
MAQVTANGIGIAYELDGPAEGPVLLMIHGVGAQLVRWPEALCAALAAAGFRTLRMDNRDIGLSTHMDGAAVPDLAEVTRAKAEGRVPDLPYTLSDMADDSAGLLDALGIERVHVLGVSLGGMIAQQLAIAHPAKVASLALMMTQSGNPVLPPSNPEVLAMLAKRAPDPVSAREDYLSHQVLLNRTIGSPAYPAPEADLRAIAARTAERAWNPLGPARQLAAARAAPDRTPALRELRVPTLVIHGADDPLILPECGDDLAAAIPQAWLLKPGGMGHDLPTALTGLFVATICANVERAG